MVDVSSFMAGKFLTHQDLPAQSVLWTVRMVSVQKVGDTDKICIDFCEHVKAFGCNKTNLRTISERYGVDTAAWVGRPLELYRTTTDFGGKTVDCIRVRVPLQQQMVAPQPVQPVAPQPVQPVQPVAPQPVQAAQVQPVPAQPVAPQPVQPVQPVQTVAPQPVAPQPGWEA